MPKGSYKGAYKRTEHLEINNLRVSLRVDYQIGGIDLASINAFEHTDLRCCGLV